MQPPSCKDDNYGGGCEEFTGDDPDLGNNSIGDNQVSSVKVQSRPAAPPDHPIQLYKNANFDDGYCYVDGEGWVNLDGGCSTYNDVVSSFKLQSGWSVRVYKDFDLNGSNACFTSTETDLGDNQYDDGTSANDSISSIYLYHQSNCPSLAPNAPSLNSPSNGQAFNEGESITLSWSATGEQYYGEFWGGPGGTSTFGWQSGTSKGIGSQWAGYTYSWHVRAKNGSSESGWSETRTFTVKPASPANLSATPASSSSINLSWTDRSGNEEGFKIYRNGSQVGTVSGGVTNYTDTGLSCGTNYSYVVKAYRGSIESDASNNPNATTSACGPAAPGLNSPANGATFNRTEAVTLSWNASSGATQYYAEFWGGPSINASSGWTANTNWPIGAQWGGNYQWRVKTRNGSGLESGWSDTRTLTIKYGSPSSLSASTTLGTQINLTWGASADAPGNIDGYRIYRNGSAIATVANSATSYSNTGLSCGASFGYTVRAYKGATESDPSNNANGATRACDTTPPTLSYIEPRNYAIYGTNVIPVRVDASDAESGVSQVEFWVWYHPDNILNSAQAAEDQSDSPVTPPPVPESAPVIAQADPDCTNWCYLGVDTDGSDGWSRNWDATSLADYVNVYFSVQATNGDGYVTDDLWAESITLDRTTASVDVHVGGALRGSYSVPPGGRVTPQYAGLMGGPVRVVSTNGEPVFASERALYGNSFNEVMGYPDYRLTTEYWFPWYDNASMQTWVLVGNPSASVNIALESPQIIGLNCPLFTARNVRSAVLS